MKALKRLVKPLVLPVIEWMKARLRQRELRAELPHQGTQAIVMALDQAGLPEGAAVLIHTSLKSIGYVEGGAEAVVDALIEAVVERRRGTLVLPTFSIDGTMHNTLSSGRVFDVRTTPSNLGAIPEVLRRRPGVARSVHPSHSFAALGPLATWLTEAHHLAGSNFGANTPMVRLLEKHGYLMGIGTHLGNVTFYHCLEDLLDDFPVTVYSEDSPFAVTCIDGAGRAHQLQLGAHAPAMAVTRIDRPENEVIRAHFTRHLEVYAGLRWFEIGATRGWVVPLEAMYRECVRLARQGVTVYSRL